MRTIRKFKLDRLSEPIVMMPKGAKILKIEVERNTPAIWAICRDDVPLAKRLIRIFRSGEALPDEPGVYLNTIVSLGEDWHCFDGGERHS